MQWIIGITDGKIEFFGKTPCGKYSITRAFDPAHFEQARVFVSEWMINDSGQVNVASSFDHPGDNGLDADFDAYEWMSSVSGRACG